LYSQGSKIRTTYISFAHKERKRLDESIVKLKAELEAKRREEITAKSIFTLHILRLYSDVLPDTLEHAESISQASLEHKKKSREF